MSAIVCDLDEKTRERHGPCTSLIFSQL